jgi:peptidoglycan hydrolase-like protein with peptidoglycan-binding domain
MAGKIEGNNNLITTALNTINRIEDKIIGFEKEAVKTITDLFSSPAQRNPTGFQERIGTDATQKATINAAAPQNTKFDYNQIRGVKDNPNVTPEFIRGVEAMAGRLGAKPEHILAAMSFETGGTFSPSITNSIGATGLIQFLKSTAEDLGTTTGQLRNMSAVEQLPFVEKYLEQHKNGKPLDTLEAVYTSILSGSPKSPDDVLFKEGTKAYDQNPLDWNKDGNITAREATTIVSANMFGGVKAVQQKLIDLGFVPKDKEKGFADGAWGTNTTNAVADFQKSRGLPQTGLIDEATGFGLFGGAPSTPGTPTNPGGTQGTGGGRPTVPTDIGLERGSRGESVKTLQDALVKLGHLTKDQVNTGYGTFGPKTQGAVEAFQKKNNLPVTGKFDAATQDAMKDIFDGVGRTNQNPPIVRSAQDELIKRGYMTKSEIGSGYGTFGPKTENAIKRFQADNGIAQTGKLGPLTYNALNKPKAAGQPPATTPTNPTAPRPPTTGSPSYSTATNGRFYNVNSGILMTDSLKPKLDNMAQKYFEITGRKLQVTSGYRPPSRQAAAMFDNMSKPGGVANARALYADKGAVNEIIRAYQANPGNRQAAIAAMTRVIENQVSNGTYISRHLRSGAVDVSTSTDLNALRSAVNQSGGRILNEGDHYHVDLS